MPKITTAILSVLATLTLAACSAGGLPSPEPPGTPTPTVPVTSVPTGPAASAPPEVTPQPTPRPTEVPGPPVASLGGGAAGPVAGELGTFFWGGLGSDSPWIVPTTHLAAAPGATLTVTLDPAGAPERWTAAWAPVRNGAAGGVDAVGEGEGSSVTLTAPGQPGSWGLLVEVHFPGGQRAAWYWSVVVAP